MRNVQGSTSRDLARKGVTEIADQVKERESREIVSPLLLPESMVSVVQSLLR